MYQPYMNQPYMGQTAPYQSANQYLDRLSQMQGAQMQPAPRYEIIHVNGENGARSLRMAPNSQCLLLDDTAPIVWLAMTDGAGYPTLTPYQITPYQAQPEPDYNDFNQRLTRLEAMVNESHVANAEQTAPAAPADSTARSGKGK